MDTYDGLSKTLRLCIERRCLQYGFAIILVLIIGAAELFFLQRQRQQLAFSDSKKILEKKQKQIRRTKSTILGAGVFCVVLFALGLFEILPAVRDLTEQRFVQVTTTYYHPSHSVGRFDFLSDGFVKVEDGARTLELPPNWTAEDFPNGHYYGEIWYSEQSEFILSFTVLEGEN